jgi:uncharacterized protein YuzE
MKVNEVITKLRVMLGAETEEVVATETRLEEEIKEEVKMAEATLVDGTVVYTEGELEAGAILYVAVEEGDAPFAPEGMHETQDGLLVTVGANGEIVSIEEKSGEAVAAEAEEPKIEADVKVEMEEKEEEEMEEEKKEEESFDAEGLLNAIADMIMPQAEQLEELKDKLATLEARFEAVADEPAANPIKNTFSKVDKAASVEDRIKALSNIRRGK